MTPPGVASPSGSPGATPAGLAASTSPERRCPSRPRSFRALRWLAAGQLALALALGCAAARREAVPAGPARTARLEVDNWNPALPVARDAEAELASAGFGLGEAEDVSVRVEVQSYPIRAYYRRGEGDAAEFLPTGACVQGTITVTPRGGAPTVREFRAQVLPPAQLPPTGPKAVAAPYLDAYRDSGFRRELARVLGGLRAGSPVPNAE